MAAHFVEVTDSGNVILSRDADDVAVVGDNHGCIPQHITVLLVTLENRADDHHVVLLRSLDEPIAACRSHRSISSTDLDQELGRWSIVRRLGELNPRILLSRAERERHGYESEERSVCFPEARRR